MTENKKLHDIEQTMCENPNDNNARCKWRTECVRQRQANHAGFEIGDIVLVEEREIPQIDEEWVGKLNKLFDKGDKYVIPIEEHLKYRIRPSPDYFKNGLYLTRQDKMTLLVPHEPL